MTVLVVQHRVRDFDAWKPVFDEHESARASTAPGAIGSIAPPRIPTTS